MKKNILIIFLFFILFYESFVLYKETSKEKNNLIKFEIQKENIYNEGVIRGIEKTKHQIREIFKNCKDTEDFRIKVFDLIIE